MHILRILQQPRFLESFKRKGRFEELVERIPVQVILTRAALVGVATYGLERLEEESAGAAA